MPNDVLALAEEELGPLDEVHRKLFQAIADGELADFSSTSDEQNDPAGAEHWVKERVLNADRIRWLCADGRAARLVSQLGICIRGARIDGKLALPYANIPFPLLFVDCAFPGGIDLRYADVRALSLRGTHADALHADGLHVGCTVHLCDGFQVNGEVRLNGARIDGNLQCDGARFMKRGGRALSADGLTVAGAVSLRDVFSAEGEISLRGADIGGELACNNAQLNNPGGYALSADGARVGNAIFLHGKFRAEGEVRLLGAEIAGDLNCTGAELVNPSGHALNADGLRVGGAVFLGKPFRANGGVRLVGGTINGQLSCGGGKFINPRDVALNAEGVHVRQHVLLHDGFRAEGEVLLLGARIGGQLLCVSGEFVNPGRDALSADSARIEGGVLLQRGFSAEGAVRLNGARIARILDCSGARFVNPGGYALNAEGATVDGHAMLCNGMTAEGRVVFFSATVRRGLVWRDVTSPADATLDLRYARVRNLRDDRASWPPRGNLLLDGLVYDELADDTPTDPKMRIDWLRRQPVEQFRSQPYEQLAAVLRRRGDTAGAKDVLVAKEQDRRQRTRLTFFERLRHYVLQLSIGYGYRPWRAVWLAIGVVALGWVLFAAGFRAELIAPTTQSQHHPSGVVGTQAPDDYPRFAPLVYSLDVFVPLVDLHQASYWLPSANRGDELVNIRWLSLSSGEALRCYFWFHIAAGWTLTTLLVVGLTGLVRK